MSKKTARFELIDRDGNAVAEASTVKELGQEAKRRWTDQERDEDRTGAGWDIQVVGSVD